MFVICLLSLLLAPAVLRAEDANLLDAGYNQMYNLEFQRARSTFEEWKRLHPQDPMGPVSKAAAYLFEELDRLHILESEFFTHDENFRRERKLSPDLAAREAFSRELSHGEQLTDETLAGAPDDTQALLAKIMVLGLRADYTALIEQHYLASLNSVKNGRRLAEKLLAIDPTCYDAHLAIGVENYMLSLKPAPVRWLLRITGAETDREEGLKKLRLTAEKGHYLRPYAQLLLAVAALRDGDEGKARNILLDLHGQFPNNRLYSEELSRIPPEESGPQQSKTQGQPKR